MKTLAIDPPTNIVGGINTCTCFYVCYNIRGLKHLKRSTLCLQNDMERVLELCQHFSVQSLVCINKCDLNPDQAERIRSMAAEFGGRVICEIPFDPQVNEALSQGQNLVEYGRGPAAKAILEIWQEYNKEL